MLELFSRKLPPIFQGITVNQDLKFIREYYNGVIEKVINYREENVWFVKGEHILNRFLKQFLRPEGFNDLDYFKMVDKYSESITRELQFSSKYNTGVFHFNNMYKGSTEAYYVKKKLIDLSTVSTEWKTFRPLKVLYTDNKSINIDVPDMMYTKEVRLIIEIDVFKLLFHYKYWVESRNFKDLDSSTESYLGCFLLPSLLGSYLDYSCWNIFSKLIVDKNFEPNFRNRLPFSITDYSRRLAKGYLEYVERFRGTKNSFDKILENIPMIASSNAVEFLQLGEIFYTRQVLWLPLLSRMGCLISLLELTGYNGAIANTDITSKVKRYIRQLLNYENLLPNNTPKHIEREFYYLMFRIEHLVD